MTAAVVAPAPFKGALAAADAARAIAAGVRLVMPGVETRVVPVADGGEGTLDALVAAAGGRRRGVSAADPLGRPVEAGLGELPGGVAVVELAQASGYERLAPGERDPERTGTWGTGELIRAALDLGARRDRRGPRRQRHHRRRPGAGPGARHPRPRRRTAPSSRAAAPTWPASRRSTSRGATRAWTTRRSRSACDVDNPFHGPRGAARVFGPQKGASPEAVARLDAGLARLAGGRARGDGASTCRTLPGRRRGRRGGGRPAALLGAELMPGAPLVLDAVRFPERLEGAALCITGEGRLDETSLAGKAPAAVAAACGEAGVPCVALCGEVGLGPGAVRRAGFAAAFPIGAAPGRSARRCPGRHRGRPRGGGRGGRRRLGRPPGGVAPIRTWGWPRRRSPARLTIRAIDPPRLHLARSPRSSPGARRVAGGSGPRRRGDPKATALRQEWGRCPPPARRRGRSRRPWRPPGAVPRAGRAPGGAPGVERRGARVPGTRPDARGDALEDLGHRRPLVRVRVALLQRQPPPSRTGRA